MKTNNFIVLADNDGTIRNTNGVKDACLDAFCVKELGALKADNPLPTSIHRRMHGRPMAEIFVAIAAEVYGLHISEAEGFRLTERLNEYIKPAYIAGEVFSGALEFYTRLKNLGIPLYILTGMEEDMVFQGLEYHGLDKLFEGILGAPKTKEENIENILKKYPNAKIIGIGDAIAEYNATMRYDGTIFIPVDFENRKKQVFPENIKVYREYSQEMWDDLVRQIH